MGLLDYISRALLNLVVFRRLLGKLVFANFDYSILCFFRNVEFVLYSAVLNVQLLAADPSLRRFKSHKKGVMAIKRLREVLTVVVIAGTLLCFLHDMISTLHLLFYTLL